MSKKPVKQTPPPKAAEEGIGDGEMFGTLIASRPPRGAAGSAGGFVGSTLFHIVLIALVAWATMNVGLGEEEEEENVTLIEIPPEAPPPPPPPPPPQEIQVAPTTSEPVALGFQTLSVPDIVPPDIPPPNIGVKITEADFSGRGQEGGRASGVVGGTTRSDLEAAPVFTPMTVRPELLNVDDVQRALVRSYPPLLRDAGIGGTPVVWFLIDETGKVIKTQLSKSSGHASLDEAAIKVASIMKFSPALNRDQKVTVWVEIPIVYKVN